MYFVWRYIHFSVIPALLSVSQFYNGLLRLLHTFSHFSIWFLWLETALFWTNFSHFLWQGLQSLFCRPSISMVILNSGLIWLKTDISLLLKMPYLHNKMSNISMFILSLTPNTPLIHTSSVETCTKVVSYRPTIHSNSVC